MVTITKQGAGRASVSVQGGPAMPARMDSTIKRWVVTTPQGDRTTTSPKLHSIGALWGMQVTVVGAPPRQPGRPRGARSGFGRRPRGFAAQAKSGPAFTAPKPDRRSMLLLALANLEDAFVVKVSESGVTPEVRKSYERYTKLKAMALGATSNAAMQTEAYAALRQSVIELLKLSF